MAICLRLDALRLFSATVTRSNIIDFHAAAETLLDFFFSLTKGKKNPPTSPTLFIRNNPVVNTVFLPPRHKTARPIKSGHRL